MVLILIPIGVYRHFVSHSRNTENDRQENPIKHSLFFLSFSLSISRLFLVCTAEENQADVNSRVYGVEELVDATPPLQAQPGEHKPSKTQATHHDLSDCRTWYQSNGRCDSDDRNVLQRFKTRLRQEGGQMGEIMRSGEVEATVFCQGVVSDE